MIRTLLAEDEPLALDRLRRLLREVAWMEIVGEARDGRSAVREVDDLEPDLLFLDVQMPELDGIQVLERIAHRPAVVFTTAYDHYAVTAFELGAIDYLVKPFGRDRFGAMLERVRRRLDEGTRDAAAVDRALAVLGDGPLERLFARKGRTIVPFAVSSIVRIEAGRSYVRVHTEQGEFLLSVTLAELEARLPRDFVRIHRSHLVNLGHVVAIEPHDDRRLTARLDDGSEVVASRTGSTLLRSLVS